MLRKCGKANKAENLRKKIIRKLFTNKMHDYHEISNLINKYKEEAKMTDQDKKNKFDEILALVNQKKLEYIINKDEAQEIVCGINFLFENKDNFKEVDKEKLRLTKIELAIKHKIDCDLKTRNHHNLESDDDHLKIHEQDYVRYLSNIVKNLEI